MRVSWHVDTNILIVNRMFKMDNQNKVLPNIPIYKLQSMGSSNGRSRIEFWPKSEL